MSVYDTNGLTVDLYTIEDTRKDLRAVKEYFQSLPIHERAMQAFLIETRHMPESVIKDSDAFYVDEELEVKDLPEWMQAESLGIVYKGRVSMYGRCVFPVKTPKGEIMGFVGWDPLTTPKYLDSYNYGYRAKTTTFFGMENIGAYYRSDKPVFITEGLMCTLWLRSKGFQAMSSLGSKLSKYCQVILKRFGARCFPIPDFDAAGEEYLKQIHWTLPLAQPFMVRYGKDIDGCRRDHEEELLEDLNHIDDPFYTNFKVMVRR